MLYIERFPATPNNLFSVTVTRTALLSFGGAMGGALLGLLDRNTTELPKYFLIFQDAPVLVLLGLFLVASGRLARKQMALVAPAWIERGNGFGAAGITAIIVTGTVYAGSRLIYQNFALSLDEFMAEFDAQIIATGRLLAAVPPEWREYVPALQPIFRLGVPENAYWISSYLPMNAALRAAISTFGDPALQGAVLAGVSIVALFGVARRLWPDRPDAAVVSVLLLACSSQFLIMAMTPYAMTAHLALNMVWLWLFLRDTRASHVLAAAVAFVACGLHQVIFHPLFAAPFLISLLAAHRWKLAAFHGAVYASALYWSLILHAVSEPIGQSADVGIGYLIRRIVEMVELSPDGVALMGLNLFRFLAWQSPLTLPLALAGFLAYRHRSRMINALALAIFFTLAVMLILIPFQGHGWGYRYLHGFLGSLSLLAAQGWTFMTERRPGADKIAQPAFFVLASILVSLLVIFPWHAYQTRAFVSPYASAVEAIRRSNAEVVVVDPVGIWYGTDLVRNDPFLRTTPKVMGLGYLDGASPRKLCQRYDVAIFERRDAERFGLRVEQTQLLTPAAVQHHRGLREIMRSLGCGRPLSGHRP
jgi:hypothetical protein